MSDMKENLELLSRSLYRLPVAELTDEQLHAVVARAVLARLQPVWQGSLQAHCAGRRAYYFSAEYLLGKAVYNNLLCTGLTGEVEAALTACGRKLDQLDCVPDPPLGNGGLGRLAACFLDSGATLNLPLDGYGLRYRCGLFRQQIQDGFQVETVEDDLQYGDPWSVCCRADTVTVEFADLAVQAVPYDLPIPGYGTAHISTLRLWESVPVEPFDFDAFNRQDYSAAVAQRTAAENLTRVLYPNDTKEDGKRLRLRQQYFLCSASLQDLLRRYLRTPGSVPEKLGTAVAIQLNDTHPVLAIPELIRLLLKQGMTLEAALGVAKEVFRYTNHTVMPEAMESWDLALLASELPEIARLLCQLDDLFCAEMQALGAEERLWHRVRPLRDGIIQDHRMTNELIVRFVNQVCRSRIFKPRIAVCVPAAITGIEADAVVESVMAAGARQVYLVDEPVAAALGAGLQIRQPHGCMVVDIGGGSTDIAVISMGGRVKAASLPVAGNAFDSCIAQYVQEKYQIAIGPLTAEQLKKQVACCTRSEFEGVMEVRGHSWETNLPARRIIYTRDLYEPVQELAARIANAARNVLESTPPELAADVSGTGILLTGGGSLLRGLAGYIAGELHTDVAIAPDPLNCVARGTAISLSEGKYLSAGFRDATPKVWNRRLNHSHDPFTGE